MRKRSTVRLVAALVLLWQLPAAALTLGVHAEEPAPTIAGLLADSLPGDETLTVRAFGSSAELNRALLAGEIDLGIIEDTGQSLPGIALVADLYPSVLHILHRSDADTSNLGRLLAGGPIWAGGPGAVGHQLAQDLATDFNAGELELLADPWSTEPTLYFVFGGILQADALARLSGFELYSFDAPHQLDHGSVAEGIALRHPFLRPFVLPAQLYPTLGGNAALTLSVTNLLAAREELPADTVYKLAMALENLRPRIAAAYPLAGVQSLENQTRAAQALPLHEGAQRYRDRDLPGFLERYAEVLALGATVTLATGTVLAAVRRQRRQSRKDRLDTFYQRLLDLRAALGQPGSNVGEIAAGVRAAQTEVMALVIEERIDADGSLMAFLTLSNRLLVEAESQA